ncbi:carboxy-S-adenosyl-L-methionine synthase CmoA [Candidatus Margulisiibacteriota bacterium]
MKDRIFEDPVSALKKFSFNSEVAGVFENMLERSVPFYNEIQNMICAIARQFARSGTNIYDLGCSTGTTIVKLAEVLEQPDINFIGVDNSLPMIKKAQKKLHGFSPDKNISFLHKDLAEFLEIENASIVVLNLCLQFVAPGKRLDVLKTVFKGLNRQGCIVLVEKVQAESEAMNDFFRREYFNKKRENGYSENEILNKERSLENVLVPLKLSDNISLLKEAGFSIVEPFFKWYNFTGLLSVKP